MPDLSAPPTPAPPPPVAPAPAIATDPGTVQQPNARSLNDLLRIRKDNLDRINHRYGAIGTAVGFKLDKIREYPPPGERLPSILIFVPKKIRGLLPPDMVTGDDRLLWDNTRKLCCNTDIISAELEGGVPVLPGLTPENAAKVRRLNSGQLGLVGGVAIENLEMPEISARQLTVSCALLRNPTPDQWEVGLLTNAHAKTQLNQKLGLVRNPAASSEIGVIDSDAQDLDDFNKRARLLLDTQESVDTHLDAAFLKLNSEWTSKVVPGVDGLPLLGKPYQLDLDTMGPIGMEVISIGQQSGRQNGRIFAYGFAWSDSKAELHWIDYLIYSDTERFSLPGDSGKLIVTTAPNYQPLALHWGGSFSQLRPGGHKEWWGYSTDIGRVLRGLKASIYEGGPIPMAHRPTGTDSSKP